MVRQVIVVLEEEIQESDLGIEHIKDKIIAKRCALVAILDRSCIKTGDKCLMT
jgi:hypothetical protein